jgi:hypothetical protein
MRKTIKRTDMARFALVSLALLAVAGGVAVAADQPAIPSTAPAATPKVAQLQGLDKTTARVTKFEAPVGQMVTFGTLQITVRDCRKRPPEQEPESAAYLDIDEILQGQAAPKKIFSGWMFASSPALNSLEDPVYDVWVLDCKTTDTASPPVKPG